MACSIARLTTCSPRVLGRSATTAIFVPARSSRDRVFYSHRNICDISTPSRISQTQSKVQSQVPLNDPVPKVIPKKEIPSEAASPQIAAKPPKPPQVIKPKPRLRATKAALSLTPEAVHRLKALLSGPNPQLIRIGVRNKGCAGMSYHLQYVEKPEKFDEVVEQDGVKVLIDSKALFSIIGSEMDWTEDKLSAKFTFKNPNIKDACGCGESFTVG